MSLRSSEQQALARIEEHLQAGDQRLKSLFTSFARLTEHEKMPGIEQLRQRWWAHPHVLLTMALLVILSGITAAVVTVSRSQCVAGRTAVASLPFASPHGAGIAPARTNLSRSAC